MKLKDYKEGLVKIDSTARKAKADLAFAYATENNPYKAGERVFDGVHTIEIKTADVRINSNGVPSCVFQGPIVDKDGNLTEENGEVWRTNVMENLDK